MIHLIATASKKLSKLFSRKNLYKLLNNEIQMVKQTDIILNIGSGGIVSEKFSVLNNKLISIDVDPDRKPDIVMDATKMNFKDNSFDIVFMIEVLEHIPDPRKAINEIYRVLKPGGRVVLSTPFIFGIHDVPYDYFRYTKYGLKVLFKGYKNLKIQNRNSYIDSVFVLLFRLVFEKNKLNKAIGILLIPLLLIIYFLTYPLNIILKSDTLTTGYFTTAIK